MSIQGKVIVFTGKISKPRHEFQALVEEHGGTAGPDVTKNTDYLVVGEKPGTKLIRASMLGIPTISEEEFLKLLEEPTSEQETPLSHEELKELKSHLVTSICKSCGKEYGQWDSIPNRNICSVCEILSPDLGPCGTGKDSIAHFWFKKTVKDNGDVVEDCLCGSILIKHPNGAWEKHEPRHVLERARKIAHQHAIQEEQAFYRRQRLQDEAERQVIKQLEVLTPDELEQLERQLNEKAN